MAKRALALGAEWATASLSVRIELAMLEAFMAVTIVAFGAALLL
jgi:hypothetical protein